MEKLFLMIIFFTPGLAMKAIYKYYNKKSRVAEANPYDYIFEAVIHGTVVFILTQVSFKLISWMFGLEDLSTNTLTGITMRMDSLTFDLKYLITTLACTIIWYGVYHGLALKAFGMIKSNNNRSKHGVNTISNTNVYEQVFRDPSNNGRLVPVEIIKDGKRITCGILGKRNSPNYTHLEFTIDYPKAVEKVLTRDKGLPEEEKILGKVRFEYYMPEHDLLIRFFNRAKLEDYWNKKIDK